MGRDHWTTSLEWAVIATILALVLAFAAATGIPVVNWQQRALAIGIVVSAWPAIALLSHATGLAKGTAFLAEIPGKALAYIGIASVLEYYLATSSAPLNDALLIRVDRALGFEWISLCNWAAAHPQIRSAMTFAYFSLQNETLLVLLVISVFYPARARRFTTALIVSSLFTIPLLWVFPVGGPFVAIKGLPQFCMSDAYVGSQHYMLLRTHGFAAIDAGNLSGIVAFPSYHATSAVLLTYFLRRIPVVYPAAIAFNALMIAATPVIGGHYIIDVVAGIVVAAATIWVLQSIGGGQFAERAPLWRTPAEVSSA
jgi:membrane-associated phospholipid phosphatase